jgi:cysteine synthase B
MNNRIDQLKSAVVKLESQVGNTPLADMSQLSPNPQVNIFAKQEWRHLGGSVKARPAFNIIKQAVFTGAYAPGQHILDASSGNTGIAYAIIGQSLGIPVTICLPKNASRQRVDLLRKYQAEIIFTSPFGSTDEAQQRARQLAIKEPGKYFYADQYANVNNWKAHYHTTADEIYKQTDGEVTHFVAGLGTTGTFIGTGRRLREIDNAIKLVSLQPDIALHGLEGWKHLETALVPLIYDSSLANESLLVSTEEAYHLIKEINKIYDYKVSPSAAANLAGAIKVAERLDQGTVVTVFPDNADKYQEVLKLIFNNQQYELTN